MQIAVNLLLYVWLYAFRRVCGHVGWPYCWPNFCYFAIRLDIWKKKTNKLQLVVCLVVWGIMLAMIWLYELGMCIWMQYMATTWPPCFGCNIVICLDKMRQNPQSCIYESKFWLLVGHLGVKRPYRMTTSFFFWLYTYAQNLRCADGVWPCHMDFCFS